MTASWCCVSSQCTCLMFFAEGVLGRESLPSCNHNDGLTFPFFIWLFGLQKWWVTVFCCAGGNYFCSIYPILQLGLADCICTWHITSDIQFWNKNKSMEGLSAKSVVVSFISQLIVFLYLLDNDTSWMILASSGVGCCIEFWKIGKAMHIEVWFMFIIPRWARFCLFESSCYVLDWIFEILDIHAKSGGKYPLFALPIRCSCWHVTYSLFN